MTIKSRPESNFAILPGLDSNKAEFTPDARDTIDDESASDVVMTRKWRDIMLVRICRAIVFFMSPILIAGTEDQILTLIEERFGFRPNRNAKSNYCQSITDWALPATRRALMKWSVS